MQTASSATEHPLPQSSGHHGPKSNGSTEIVSMTTHRKHFLVYLAFRTQDNPDNASPCQPCRPLVLCRSESQSVYCLA